MEAVFSLCFHDLFAVGLSTSLKRNYVYYQSHTIMPCSYLKGQRVRS